MASMISSLVPLPLWRLGCQLDSPLKDTGVREKTLLQRRTHLDNSLKQLRGWIAVSAAGLQGKGLRKKECFFHRHRYHSGEGQPQTSTSAPESRRALAIPPRACGEVSMTSRWKTWRKNMYTYTTKAISPLHALFSLSL